MSAAPKQEQVLYNFRNPVRVAFANVITPKAYKKNGVETGDPRYDMTVLLEPDSPDVQALRDLCIAQLKTLYPGKAIKARRLSEAELANGDVEVAVPWSDGTKQADRGKEEGKDREFMRGKVVIKASSKYAPALSGIENGKIVSYSNPETRGTLDKLFYSGAWVGPLVAIHTYKSQGTPGASNFKPGGVSLWLNAVCFVKHDTKLIGSSVNAAEVFAHYAGSVSNVDPTAGASAGDEL